MKNYIEYLVHDVFLKIPCLHKLMYSAAQRSVIKLVLLHILFFLQVLKTLHNRYYCPDLNNENIWSHEELKCFGHMELVKYRVYKKINEQLCLSARLSI